MSNDGTDPEDRRGIEPSGSHLDPQPATLTSRCAARLVDGVIVLVFAMIVRAPIHIGQGLYVTALVFGVLTFAYFLVYETTQGCTLGKKLIGICVLGPDSAPRPTVRQSAVRNAFTLLSVIPYVGALFSMTAYILIASTIASDAGKQGMHDRLAGGTRVVKCPRPNH
ncbi:RDD family protein [Mycolicibacterium sphagni]|uniref:RDD family protein n=1 Tax=Mycolicibacterium sphagni TaxID=1786 RepID=A0ABX2K556_9MYCO|nr:RDD family protein [Mycolicibacterium sphagni]NTY63993.1 RDD family protein [Mycolicibacterium sphagni]